MHRRAFLWLFIVALFISEKVAEAERQELFLSFMAREVLEVAEQIEQLDEEDKMLSEAYDLLFDSYKKLIELTAMYYGGLHASSYNALESVLWEVVRDFSQILKILIIYLGKVYNNPKLSWQSKCKKGLYFVGAVTILGYWIKECLKHFSQENFKGKSDVPEFLHLGSTLRS